MDPKNNPANELSEEDFINRLADLDEVDNNDEATFEEVEEPIETEENENVEVSGNNQEEDEDPYAFLERTENDLDNIPYNSVEELAKGYKNIQSLASKIQKENEQLKKQLDGISDDDIEEYADNNGYDKNDIKEMIAEVMKNQFEDFRNSQAEILKQVEMDNKIDSDYKEVLSDERFKANTDKIHSIIKYFPNIVENNTISNPYKFALELAVNPNLISIYKENPSLVNLENGGINLAKKILNTNPNNLKKVVDNEKEKAINKERKRVIEMSNSVVSEPSSGEVSNEKTIGEMTKEEVFSAVGYKPED